MKWEMCILSMHKCAPCCKMLSLNLSMKTTVYLVSDLLSCAVTEGDLRSWGWLITCAYMQLYFSSNLGEFFSMPIAYTFIGLCFQILWGSWISLENTPWNPFWFVEVMTFIYRDLQLVYFVLANYFSVETRAVWNSIQTKRKQKRNHFLLFRNFIFSFETLSFDMFLLMFEPTKIHVYVSRFFVMDARNT